MIRRCLVFVFTWSDCEWNSRLAERARVMARMAMTARMESQTMNPLIHLIRRIQVRERSQAPDRDSVMSEIAALKVGRHTNTSERRNVMHIRICRRLPR